MAKIDDPAQDFLAQKIIAVVGVSDKRETGCNLNHQKFKKGGYKVYAVNQRISTFDGTPCYPDLESIPEKPDAVFMLTSPKVTEHIVQHGSFEKRVNHAKIIYQTSWRYTAKWRSLQALVVSRTEARLDCEDS